MKEPRIVPVLLGLDLNAYSVAISFYEIYGIVSHAFGRYRCGITENSRIVRTHIVPNMLDSAGGLGALFSFADRNRDKTLLLIPCADWYHEFMQRERESLSKRFLFLIPDRELYELSSDKTRFYSLLQNCGIPYPPSRSFSREDTLQIGDFTADFSYPAVLKPADSTKYWEHPFPNMKKVYFPRNPMEAKTISEQIFRAGYDGKLILQKRITSDPPRSAVLTVFANKEGVKGAVLARVLLEENAPRARGNYSALITVPLDAISYKLIRMTERIGYTGVANFDILYDKSGAYVLEMNARQGRSGDYVRAAGLHFSEFLVSSLFGESFAEKFHYPHVYWHCVSDHAVRTFAADEDMVEEAKELKKYGYSFSPYEYEGDLKHNPVRRLYVHIHTGRRSREIAKYAKGREVEL